MDFKKEIKLKGYVGDWDFDPDYVDWVLNQSEGAPVRVVIDSLGGSAFAAASIAAAFAAHGNVTAHFQGYNASAATVAAMGAKTITMDSHAMLLVHKCSAQVWEFISCNSDQLDALIQKLQTDQRNLVAIDLNTASLYAARCKKTKEQLIELMSQDRWLTAEQAKEWGFIDEITKSNAPQQKIPQSQIQALADSGVPVPPGYSSKQSLLNKIFSYIKPSSIKAMTKILSSLCQVLKTESLEFIDGKTTITEAQAQEIENALSAKDKTIEDLNKQVQQLKAAPAEQHKQVIDHTTEPISEYDKFMSCVKNAKEMFNAVS